LVTNLNWHINHENFKKEYDIPDGLFVTEEV
jgi:hypothetical protein